MAGRLIAIGDIHGCLAALEAVLAALAPRPDDTIVTLGDHTDRGPDSCGTVELLRTLGRQTRLVMLLGNHDEMMLKVWAGRLDLLADWLAYGGQATLASYQTPIPQGIWPEHVELLQACPLYFETEQHFFVHGNYQPAEPLAGQPRAVLLWESLKNRHPGPHYSGKTAILGHSAQKSGAVLDLGHLKCIDTWCYGEGCLTAMEVYTGQLWQADKEGRLRRTW
ncbi:MAG: metallophosphoesterase [Thermoguttaceae bacterium]|jgi:serine/threonine protein phosphatase 1